MSEATPANEPEPLALRIPTNASSYEPKADVVTTSSPLIVTASEVTDSVVSSSVVPLYAVIVTSLPWRVFTNAVLPNALVSIPVLFESTYTLPMSLLPSTLVFVWSKLAPPPSASTDTFAVLEAPPIE